MIYGTDDCIACGICAEVCAYDAVYVGDIAIFDSGKCVCCGECIQNCPVDCIVMCDDRMPVDDLPSCFDEDDFLGIWPQWDPAKYMLGHQDKTYTDCSGLIWGVYNDMGLPYTRCGTNGFATNEHWQHVTDPQIGDIVVWPGHHSAILYNYGDRNVFYCGENGVGWGTLNGLINFFPGIDYYYYRYKP